MGITREKIVHVANLARLELDEASVEKFSGQIETILEYIDMLNKVDTEGVNPTAHAVYQTNAFREDEPGKHLDREAALANAPEQDGENFLVPKVIG